MTDTAQASQAFQGNQAHDRARQHNGNVNGNVYHSETIEATAFGSKKKGFFSPIRLLTERKNSKALIEAARDGKLNLVEYYLKQTYVDINHTIENTGVTGLSALHEAAYRGHYAVAHMLLQPWAGADAGLQVSETSYTPLMCAAFKGQDKMITYLRENGASLEARKLRKGKDYDNALTIAISRRCYSTAKLLLDHGANPNSQLGTPGGRSRVPMHTAIHSGQRYVELLLESGARADTEFLGAELSLRTKYLSHAEPYSLYGVAEAFSWPQEFFDKLEAHGIRRLPADSHQLDINLYRDSERTGWIEHE